MSRTARHGASLLGLAAGAALACTALCGCVDRRFVITSDPPGAVVFINNKLVGQAPVDAQFIYYGTYDFRLVHEGSETLVVHQRVKQPWYEFFPLDFISENLIPFTIRDVRRYTYQLRPVQIVPPETLLGSADQLREKGRAIGNPVTPQQPVPVVPVPGPAPLPALPPLPGPPPAAPPVPGMPPAVPGPAILPSR
jgi:hypothetical protein